MIFFVGCLLSGGVAYAVTTHATGQPHEVGLLAAAIAAAVWAVVAIAITFRK